MLKSPSPEVLKTQEDANKYLYALEAPLSSLKKRIRPTYKLPQAYEPKTEYPTPTKAKI
jgi:hypothetical protein